MNWSWVRVAMVGSLGMVLLLGVGGCASSGGTSDSGTSSSASSSASGGMQSVPSSSKLARINKGMTDVQVRKILGEPDNSSNYMTGKAWIPFYFGGDTHRSEWIYSGVGRVVFSRNRWSGSLTVIDLIHNPGEQG